MIAGLSLVGLALGMLVLRWVRLRAAQYAPIYQEAQEHLVGKVMEYIRGISVLRSFSKGDEGQREVRAAFQEKWDADYGQERLRLDVLRFYGVTFKLMELCADCGGGSAVSGGADQPAILPDFPVLCFYSLFRLRDDGQQRLSE